MNNYIFYTTGGVKHEDPLSFTLFSIYINDFPSFLCDGKDIDADGELLDVNCLPFADNIVLMANSEIMLYSQRLKQYFQLMKDSIIHHKPISMGVV